MQKIFGFLAAAMIVLTPAAALAEGAVAVKGKMLYGAGGSRLGRISSVKEDGSAQIIIDGRLVTVPAATISVADSKLVTTLSKNDVINR
jgi:hypothetical protein